MVERIIELSVRYKWAVFAATVALALFAADSVRAESGKVDLQLAVTIEGVTRQVSSSWSDLYWRGWLTS